MAIKLTNGQYIKLKLDGTVLIYQTEDLRNNGKGRIKASTIKNFCDSNLIGINLKIEQLLKGKKTKLKKSSKEEASKIIDSIPELRNYMNLKTDLERYLVELKEAQGTNYEYPALSNYFNKEDIITSIPKPLVVYRLQNKNYNNLEEIYDEIKKSKRFGTKTFIDC